MEKLSRREFIYASASSFLFFPLSAYAINIEKNNSTTQPSNTIVIIEQAFKSEMTAHKHYTGYVEKALAENFTNIAYTFHAFSISEKIHADNYKRIITESGSEIKNNFMPIDVRDTKSNLISAAEKELEKIEITYPNILEKLETDGSEEAIIYCMYSWKSHRQHEGKIKELQKYSGMFFGTVAKKIEGMDLDFHVCEICGSTIDEEPNSPCVICNRSMSHYIKVMQPV